MFVHLLSTFKSFFTLVVRRCHLRLCLVVVKHFSENKYFPKRKIFSSVWLHYENCCRKYFHVFGSILKILFSYKFFKVSQHLNKFHYRKFQNHNHNHKFFKVSRLFSQRHYHTTTTTTKIKITERDRWVEGEIERRRDRAAWCAVRLARSSACDRQTGAWGSPATSKA